MLPWQCALYQNLLLGKETQRSTQGKGGCKAAPPNPPNQNLMNNIDFVDTFHIIYPSAGISQ